MAPEPDYAVQLNNYLQSHPSGNLTPCFRYVMTTETGPDLQMAHHATAKFRGTAIGRGRGFSKGAAKRDAARAAIQYIHNHSLSEPIESKNSDALLRLENYPRNHTGGSLIPGSRGPGCKPILITTGATAQLPNSMAVNFATESDFPLTMSSK